MTADEIIENAEKGMSSFMGTMGAVMVGTAMGTVAQRIVDSALDKWLDWARAKMIEKGLY